MTDLSAEQIRHDVAGRVDQLGDRIVALAEVNSGSFNPDGVNRVGERLAGFVEDLNPDTIEIIPVEPTPVLGLDGIESQAEVGSALRAIKNADAPFRICLFGHLDTVFGIDHPFQSVAIDGNTFNGPGVADCKGGLIIATEILSQLGRASWADSIGWELLVVPDEEIGSFGSKVLLNEAATRANAGLGFEPALPSGGVAGARKGSVTGHLVVHGRASHVGRAHADGRSAILELSRLIIDLEALNSQDGVTVNCGRISGGGALNVVPDLAVGSFNMRVETPDDQAFVMDRFEEHVADSALDVELVWGSTRPPKVRTAELETMFTGLARSAHGLGLDLPIEDTGGCCDGNDLAAAGLPNIDSLGIRGGAIHSADEFAHIDSIPERVALVTELVRTMAS